MMNEKIITPYEAVDVFEKTIAEYAGAKYGVAVDSCCNALFLSCIYAKVRIAQIPCKTYPGVACAIINAGAKLIFNNVNWQGAYKLCPNRIVDSALRFRKGMYVKNSLYCLSFHIKKHLPIGRGGMILTNSKDAYDWFKKARFDGRDSVPLSEDKIEMTGWNMYMTPEQAVRGVQLFNLMKDTVLSDIPKELQGYPDLSQVLAYKKHYAIEDWRVRKNGKSHNQCGGRNNRKTRARSGV